MSYFERSVWFFGFFLFALTAYVLFDLKDFNALIATHVTQNMPQNSPLAHEITAVLLYFRSLDTLLEVAVILLSIVAVSVVNPLYRHKVSEFNSAVIQTFTVLIVPFALITSFYILSSGTYQSGGAFQAGAVLGGAIIILYLSKNLHIDTDTFLLKIFYTAGLALFIGVGVFTAVKQNFLAYPAGYEYYYILSVELCLMLSIAAILSAYFISLQRHGR
jgi:multisubunit Na+/H+ antiporter MnhB subunit